MGFSFCRICFIMITVKFIKQMKKMFAGQKWRLL